MDGSDDLSNQAQGGAMYRSTQSLATAIFSLAFVIACTAITGCSALESGSDPGSETNSPAIGHPNARNERTKLTDADRANNADLQGVDANAVQQAERLQRELDRLDAARAAAPSPQDRIGRKFAEANRASTDTEGNTDANPDANNGIDFTPTQRQVTNNAPKPNLTEKTDIDDDANSTTLVANPAPIHTVETTTSVKSPKFDPKSLDRKTLTKLLVEKILESNDPNASNVIAIAGLALADMDGVIDPLRIEGLKPSERQLVQQFQSLFTHVSGQMARGESIDKNSVVNQISNIIGEQPLSIRKLKLCNRVRGYGVYSEMESTTLLAGREHPFIVYAELDNFSVKKSEKNLYNQQVKLSQELVLYNIADGLAVWRQPEQMIVDESRNRRRDFFTVQPTRLPGRLGAGKYILKVRIRDKHAGTRAEESIEINVVADPSLVKPTIKPKTDVRPG